MYRSSARSVKPLVETQMEGCMQDDRWIHRATGPDGTEARWLLEYLLVSKAKGDAADPALPLVLWWWMLVFRGGCCEGCGKDRRTLPHWQAVEIFPFEMCFYKNICMNVSGLLLCCSFAYFCADYFYILLKRPFTAAISLKGFFFSGVKYSFSSHKVNIFVKVAQFAAVSFGQEFLWKNSKLRCQ